MNRDIAFEWADALESGNFKQCYGEMEKVDPLTGEVSYCAMGVLKTLRKEWLGLDMFDLHDVAEMRGMGDIFVDNRPANIYFLNDIKKWELKKFADFIREQWERI